MKNLRPVPIGVDKFKRVIEENYVYVDKTDLIEDILIRGALVYLFPRPRRFGKTLAMSMLEEYFDIRKKEENKDLFKGLKITKADKKILDQQGKYPVISLSLKEAKANTWESELNKIKSIISRLYQNNEEVKEVLSEKDKRYYDEIVNETARSDQYEDALKNLSLYLNLYYKERVVILIDEYDAPIETGYINGFYKQSIDFMRNFLGGALKTNDVLKFSCLTGILRVSKESIFSDLNNLDIYSVLDKEYSEYFGFLPDEVEKLLAEYGVENTEEVKTWYNGYNFAGTKIYNPWSILNVINRNKIEPYWINTGGTKVLEDMLRKGSSIIKKELEQLLLGETIPAKLNEHIVFSELNGSKNDVYNFMIMSGYLTVDRIEIVQEDRNIGHLRIPNIEVKIALKSMIERWFQENTGREEIEKLQIALLEDRRETAEDILNSLMEKSMSSFDNAENFYHGFVLGLMVDMGNEYIVRSNRESGFGRYDMKIEKKDGSIGVILEFKFVKEENEQEKMANTALQQIEKNKYYLDMKERGITNILKYGIAFNNKKAVLR